MLSERQLQNLLKVFEERMQDITEDYLTRMGKHLRDIGRLTDTDVHRVIQMKRVNKNLEHIKARIARAASMSIKDVERVFEAVAESDYRFAATTFGEDHAPRVKDNKYLERIIKAQLRATAQEFKNLSQTTIMSEGYKNAVDVAVQSVQAGLTDYNSAIRKAMKAAAQEGLRVQYPNSGLTRRLDTAIRQNVLDGIRSINQDVLKQAGKEFGADGVEISAHALCAQDHLPYQGRQFEQKEFDRLQNNLDRPFGMWNCKHTVFPILVGISEPAHTEEELQAYIRNSNEEITIDGKTMSRYEWTQHQRKLETAVRYQKDIAVAAKASGDMIARREAQAKINRLTEEYAKISDAAGLIEKPERMRVAGFNRVKTADQLKNTTERAKIEEQKKIEWLKDGYDKAVKKGDVSALAGFEHYLSVAQEVERKLVGTITADGVEIKGYKTHFVDRIIGSYEKQREPVSVDDAKDALTTDNTPTNSQRGNNPSRTYKNSACWVSVNPNTATLIQASPRKKGV